MSESVCSNRKTETQSREVGLWDPLLQRMVLKGISLLDVAGTSRLAAGDVTATRVPYKSIFCFYV